MSSLFIDGGYIMVTFASKCLEHESMVKIQVAHDWIRDLFSLFVILMSVFIMYDVE